MNRFSLSPALTLFGAGKLFSFSLFLSSLFLPTLPAQPALAPLEQHIEEAYEEWDIPGMSVAIVKDGEVVLSKGYGMLEAGKGQAADGGSIYAIASNTKAFIATAIGILVEEGKLRWDDPVRKHLPDFALFDEYVSEHTKVEDLLCHRVGLGTFSGDVIWYKSNYSAEEIVRRIRYVPQAFEFRAGYGYSNLMFIAAGEVIRAVTGKSWDGFIKRRIFDPLGMERTRTSVDDLAEMDNLAMPHKPVDGENIPIPYVNWDNVGAAGGILSCVDDMAKWLQLQLDRGLHEGKALFSPLTQERLWTPHNSFRVPDTQYKRYGRQHYSGYGLGWRLFDYDGRMVASHGGGYDGMYSRVALMPEENLGLVVLTNSMKGISTALMYRIFDYFLGREATDWSKQGLNNYLAGQSRRAEFLGDLRARRAEGTTPTLPAEAYAGLYRDPMYGDIEVGLQEGKLSLHFSHAPALAADLEHWHYDTYRINWRETHAWFDFGTVQFVTDNNRNVIELRFDVPNGDIFFHEIHAERVE